MAGVQPSIRVQRCLHSIRDVAISLPLRIRPVCHAAHRTTRQHSQQRRT